MQIKQILDSGSVVRYHSTLITNKQYNSEHQWETGVILKKIYPECSVDLLFYALVHDSAEIFTSDVAAPVKRAKPVIKQMLDEMEYKFMRDTLKIPEPNFSKEEMLAVKYADILSGVYFTTRRAQAGDVQATLIRDKWVEYYGALPYLNDLTDLVLKEIRQ